MTKKKTDKDNGIILPDMNNNPVAYKEEFETVYGIIAAHKKRAMNTVHNESLKMLWEVGAFVSNRLKMAVWGDSVVRMLAEYIHTKSPKAKGWSFRTIYKMVQFYETYSSEGFSKIVNHYGMQKYLMEAGGKEVLSREKAIVPIELAQIGNEEFVPIEMAQIPTVLFSTGPVDYEPM